MIRWLRDRMRQSKPPRTDLATAVQIEFIEGVCAAIGCEPPDKLEELTRAEADVLIDALMLERGHGDRLDAEPLERRPGPR